MLSMTSVSRFTGTIMLVLAVSRGVVAQPPMNNAGSAQSLFNDAKTLMANNQFEQACPKLEESQRLAPAAGTLYKLGECYEGLKKFASAYSRFVEAADQSKKD